MTSARAIASGQTVPVRGNVDLNVEEHLRLVHVAAEEHVQVLVFPELSLTGYELDLADDLAFSESDPRLAPLVQAASSWSMTLIVGVSVRLSPSGRAADGSRRVRG
jgi:predicted amidohydrolase